MSGPRGWMRALLVLCLLVVAAPAPADASTAPADEVRAYLRSYMARVKAPGMAYAVVRGSAVVSRGVWGVDGAGRAMTTRTPFLLGSVSKSFTALAVAQLVEAGRVDPDAAVSAYVPWLRLGGAAPAVTVRQLLTHTSGLPQVFGGGLTDRYDNRPGGLQRSVRDLAALRPVAAPGAVHEYSDANYLILGALVEAVSGETFGGYLRGHVLDPLGMTRSAATAGEARVLGPAGWARTRAGFVVRMGVAHQHARRCRGADGVARPLRNIGTRSNARDDLGR